METDGGHVDLSILSRLLRLNKVAGKLPINLDNLLHQRTVESERVEYKAGWNPESILHSLCAFANDFHNLGGGYVLVGIAEQTGRPVLPPVGLQAEQIDTIQKELLNLGNSAIQPPYHPLTAVYEVQGRLILVLWAPGGETRPYKARVSLSDKKTDWAFYLRKHSSTVRARGEDERELLSLAATVPFDDRYQQSASLDDLSPYLMREFLQEVGSDLAAEAKSLDVEALGRRMGVIGGPAERAFPKNVGLLFFNEHPERFFPATQIDVVYFPDGPGGDRFEEKEFRGPLGRITRDAVDYIGRNYLTEMVVKHPDRPEAERFWNFPLAAIEEAVVNAVYHRSYEIREPVEVRITPEELVVLSFPGPDRSIRLTDLQAGRAVSRRYRNRRIGEFLKELDLTEGRSTGIPKILRVMQANGSPLPVFETDGDHSYFLIRLPVHEAFAPIEEKVQARDEVYG
ncbi:RNA-binding domain-containing protein, partial [Methylobacillus sp.]|uniref:RNA-binding domain-containing protein n=1 Tax=Methylobacillus sp. TaxID=56818 RepID=UPI002FE0103B